MARGGYRPTQDEHYEERELPLMFKSQQHNLFSEVNMAASSKTLAHGTLGADTDSWLLVGEHVTPLDISLDFDTSLQGEVVSVTGTMGVPPSSHFTKFIVENIVSHEAIANRAHEIHQSDHGGSAGDNWLRAERELLSL